MKRMLLYTADVLSQTVSNLLFVLIAITLLLSGYVIVDTYYLYAGEASLKAELMSYKPSGTMDESAQSMAALQKLNPDVCGWLTVPDTGIDYPVVHDPDNYTYINHNVYGEYALQGSIFMDFRSSSSFSDFYTLLYGHHMEGGHMFGDLDLFMDKEFFDAHSTARLILPGGKICTLDIVALIQNKTDDRMCFNPQNANAAPEDFVRHVAETATYLREDKLGTDGRYLAMSTCASGSDDARTIVLARIRVSN